MNGYYDTMGNWVPNTPTFVPPGSQPVMIPSGQPLVTIGHGTVGCPVVVAAGCICPADAPPLCQNPLCPRKAPSR